MKKIRTLASAAVICFASLNAMAVEEDNQNFTDVTLDSLIIPAGGTWEPPNGNVVMTVNRLEIMPRGTLLIKGGPRTFTLAARESVIHSTSAISALGNAGGASATLKIDLGKITLVTTPVPSGSEPPSLTVRSAGGVGTKGSPGMNGRRGHDAGCLPGQGAGNGSSGGTGGKGGQGGDAGDVTVRLKYVGNAPFIIASSKGGAGGPGGDGGAGGGGGSGANCGIYHRGSGNAGPAGPRGPSGEPGRDGSVTVETYQ